MTIDFPELPKYEFSWRSLQVEPVPLSGERITLGIIVKGDDQQLIATNLVHPEKLKIMYGDEYGTGLSDSLSACLKVAEGYYQNNPLSADWQPPLERFYLDKLNSSLAENIEDGLMRASMVCSSFGFSAEISGKTKSPSFYTNTDRVISVIKDIIKDTRKNNGFTNTPEGVARLESFTRALDLVESKLDYHPAMNNLELPS